MASVCEGRTVRRAHASTLRGRRYPRRRFPAPVDWPTARAYTRAGSDARLLLQGPDRPPGVPTARGGSPPRPRRASHGSAIRSPRASQAIRHEARAGDIPRALRGSAQLSHLTRSAGPATRPAQTQTGRWPSGNPSPGRRDFRGDDRTAALGAVGIPGLVHGDRDRMEGHNDAVPIQEVRGPRAPNAARARSRARQYAGAVGEERCGHSSKAVARLRPIHRDRVVNRRHRRAAYCG